MPRARVVLNVIDDSDDEDADVLPSAAAKKTSALLSSSSSSSYSNVHTATSSSQYEPRPVALPDERLLRIAREAADSLLQWDDIRGHADGPGGWKTLDTTPSAFFSVATRRDSRRFAVRASGLVPCSVAELRRLLHTSDSDTHVQQLRALFQNEFRGGAVAYTTALEGQELAVKTATFEHHGWWRAKPIEWCYVDAIMDTERAFDKVSTSLQPRDVFAGRSHDRVRFVKHIVTGYRVRADPQAPRQTDVCFYGELVMPRQLGIPLPRMPHAASDSAMKARLLDMARRCDRLTVLVRRRRLGVQVLADRTRLALSLANAPCVHCGHTQLLAKQCRLCGHAVCDACSDKHERERFVRDHLRVHVVRVCSPCLKRVDRALFDSVETPRAPQIVPDAATAKTPSVLLAEAFHQALSQALTGAKKSAIGRVLRRVLGLPNTNGDSSAGGDVDVDNTVAVLDEHLDFPVLSADECALANDLGRAYPLASVATEDPDVLMAYPIPEDEARRTAAIQRCRVREVGHSDELSLICELATQQFGFMITMVAIADRLEAHVVACSVPVFEGMTMPRQDAFCSHTVMSELPLLVLHPEADVRFHRITAVQQHGTRFYCGFPLVADDGSVLGSLCCLDHKTRELAVSEFTILKRFAATASKLLQLNARHA
ncbi:hypothetical protein ATCC90586_000602 [Pythium insidiosum]|nr:hypothetical protein ATCC90586_000602 [Pythium insidiosum]